MNLWALKMPGKSYAGELAPLTAEEQAKRGRMRAHVQTLAVEIGERHMFRPAAMQRAVEYIERELARTGRTPRQIVFNTRFDRAAANIELTLEGDTRADETVVVGAHYDSIPECPGANDNGTGVAALLEIAQTLCAAPRPCARTLKFVAFANEELFQDRDAMGSYRYAQAARARGEKITAMYSLETIGYFSDEPGSQKYPPLVGAFYPTKGNFIGFVGNTDSRRLVLDSIDCFRNVARFPSEGIAAPEFIRGIGFSDHWSFWKAGYPGVMVTDTAPFRYPHYHLGSDTPDKIDFERMTRVVCGLERVIENAAGTAGKSG